MKSMKKTMVAMACALSLVATTPALVNLVESPVIAEAGVSTAKVESFYAKSKNSVVSLSYNIDTIGSGYLVVQHKKTGKIILNKYVKDGNKGTSVLNLPSTGEYSVLFKSSNPYAVKYERITVKYKTVRGAII